jgi:hypothetical protein
VPNLDTVVAFHATHPKHITRLDPRGGGAKSSRRTQRSQARHWEATGAAGRRGVGGRDVVSEGDQLTGGEPGEGETEIVVLEPILQTFC